MKYLVHVTGHISQLQTQGLNGAQNGLSELINVLVLFNGYAIRLR